MAARLAALLLVALAAGCVQPQPEGAPAAPESWFFTGSFTSGYTQDDVRAVCGIVSPDEPCVMGASEPPAYGGGGGSRAACDDARTRVLAVPHVARVDVCRRMA